MANTSKGNDEVKIPKNHEVKISRRRRGLTTRRLVLRPRESYASKGGFVEELHPVTVTMRLDLETTKK